MALSHIIATKFSTMIDIVEQIEQREAKLDKTLEDYTVFLNQNNAEYYNNIVVNYKKYKKTLIDLIAFSADSKTEEAYATANSEFEKFGNEIQKNIELLVEDANAQAKEAKGGLTRSFNTAMVVGIITVFLSISSIIIVVILVIRQVINPIRLMQKQLFRSVLCLW